MTGTPPVVHLLPIYDEYLNALRDRSLARDPVGPTVTTADFVGWPHQLAIDGILRGAWRRVNTAGAARIEVRPFRPLSRKERDALDRAVAQLGRFAGLPTTFRIVSL